ncbi:hypothetical protein Bhyg_02602 [Pseudolycoriella hygida]|uniref:Uncharacterized protein n=1 Tax=Pseudolycoriella hygida TaxID=35572 RepID=A0A9Q0S8P9_9DIPT|nr:hypothetical protein Bhyg_02602 [Pseudolycoriella hygida]
MNSTPQRSTLNTSVFSPVRFPDSVLSPKSPKNDPLGIRLKVLSIIKTIVENHSKWESAHKRGISLCGTNENIKKSALDRMASEPSSTLYPDDLKVPSEKLKIIVTIFKDVLDSSRECLRQLISLQKLQSNSNEKLLKTWTLTKVVDSLSKIVKAYEGEYNVKVLHDNSISRSTFCVDKWCDPVILNFAIGNLF